MCDTFVIRDSESTIFAKNSDREPNEAQAIRHLFPVKRKEKSIHCTHQQIPAYDRKYEVILSCPFQMWGAEMGCNEKGLAMGNEAVFTKIPFEKGNKGLTGMDMIRIALETCATSSEAVQLCITLLESYGQDVTSGYQQKNFYYHNSFLIVDISESWKLETAGKHWAAKKLGEIDAISNGLTITSDYDLLSRQAKAYALKKGYCQHNEEFSFAKAFNHKLYSYLSKCKIRRQTSISSLQGKIQSFNISDAAQILRSHNSGNVPFHASQADTSSICMHPTSLLNPSQTNGSMIVELTKSKLPAVWITGTSMPCLSIYKPLLFGQKIEIGPIPGYRPDQSLWWKAEKLHRAICRNYQNGIQFTTETIKQLQTESFSLQSEIVKNSVSVKNIWVQHQEWIDHLLNNADLVNQKWSSFHPIYRLYHSRLNKTLFA